MSEYPYTIRTRKKRFAKKVRKNPLRYLNSHGLRKFAEVMVAPMLVSFNYHEIGRKLLMVDDLPQGAIPVRHELPKSDRVMDNG